MDPHLAQKLDEIEYLLNDLRELNADGAPTRSRELSLAITKLEEGKHWLLAAWSS